MKIIKQYGVEFVLFCGILLIFLMQVRGAGLFGDFSQFYYSGVYYFQDDSKTYTFGSLFDLFQQYPKLNDISTELQAYSFRYFSPPNTSPIFYLILFPLFFIGYTKAVYLFMIIGLILSIISTYLFAKKFDFEFKLMLFLYLFSFSTLTNIQISQIGNYIYALVLFILIVENKYLKYVLIGILISLKVFFGLVLVYLFIHKKYKAFACISGITSILICVMFKFDVTLAMQYMQVMQLNLPIKISYNQSIWGLVSLFSTNIYMFYTYGVFFGGMLMYVMYGQKNALNILYLALLLNPLSLIYYNNIYIIAIMLIYAHINRTKAIIWYILINIPIQLTTYQDVDVLKLMPIWYIISLLLHFIGMILIIKDITNLNISKESGTEASRLHILNFV